MVYLNPVYKPNVADVIVSTPPPPPRHGIVTVRAKMCAASQPPSHPHHQSPTTTHPDQTRHRAMTCQRQATAPEATAGRAAGVRGWLPTC